MCVCVCVRARALWPPITQIFVENPMLLTFMENVNFSNDSPGPNMGIIMRGACACSAMDLAKSYRAAALPIVRSGKRLQCCQVGLVTDRCQSLF